MATLMMEIIMVTTTKEKIPISNNFWRIGTRAFHNNITGMVMTVTN